MASSAKSTSSSMSAITSSQGVPPLPPPPFGSQKNAENAAKRQSPIFAKPPSSSISSNPTNNDLFTLILQMRDHIQEQDKTNERILRETGDIKKQKKSVEDHSPLIPRSLNFDTPVGMAIKPEPAG
ncbi:hypothetical protein HanXRQr2_Chr17g0818101 [Helianthus annuus]|uniref:Uncharacterized protein n=1 Tax=Helianthus annuus TaxID=4232 RepID=A0A9K3DK89_HELAN|nr:hypothetical protein HanXRQr2_Chr17g0818101 [Helianthus annuus]